MRLTPAGLSRRDFLAIGGGALAATLLPRDAGASLATGTPLHGISVFGDLKYPPGFAHFDYASPDAPQGGTFNFQPPNWVFNQSVLTFNTLNSFVSRGDAPPRMELCFDSLMTGALDEPDALYGLLAESVTIADDRNSFVFRMRAGATFHDGSPVTTADAAFTFNLLKDKGHPSFVLALADMVEAVAEGDDLRITFNGNQSPQTVFAVAGFPVLSKADIEAHPFDGSPMRPLLGSGPYKVGRVAAGQTIEYDRVDDYWGKDLGVHRGLYHFDTIRIEFYRERQAAFEAFKKGAILFRQEFTSRVWATEYDFPAILDGRVVKREFPADLRPSMQAWAVNQRREKFSDVRVREALGLCFDFEWTNRNLFYDAYERSNSCFERSDYKAEGAPTAAELELLEPFRAELPDAAFGDAVVQFASDGSGRDRKLLRRARDLLAEVGWKASGGVLRNEAGETFSVELLVQDQSLTRIASPFSENMRAIGIDATIRLVDSAQYQARQNDYDFDMVMMAQSFGATPTRDQLANTFHSRAAGLVGSRNLSGTNSPAVDALIEKAGGARDREEFVTILRALDRVLRARRDWIPNWYAANHRAAYWDMFGFREPKPDYGFPVEILWWRDEEKAKAIGKG